MYSGELAINTQSFMVEETVQQSLKILVLGSCYREVTFA